MSRLRPECGTTNAPAIPNDTALFLIRDSVERRGALIYGKLRDGQGGHCAVGAMWADNPKVVLNSALIDEVAAVNDADPKATPRQRWLKVRSWIRWKVRVLALKSNASA